MPSLHFDKLSTSDKPFDKLRRDLRTGIGAAMEVHRILGPGFLESVYEEALAHEFDPSTGSGRRLRGIPYERQAKLAVRYKGIVAGEFRADFPSAPLRAGLVDGKVVVELKAIKALTEGDEAQLLNYPSTALRQACIMNMHLTNTNSS